MILDILRSNSSKKATLQKENHLIPDRVMIWVLSYAPPKTTIGLLGARHLFTGFSVGFGGWHLLLHHCGTPATNASAKGFGRGSSPPNANTTLVLHRIWNGRDGLEEVFLQECGLKKWKSLWQSMYQTSWGVEYLDKVHPIQRAHEGVKLRSWTSTQTERMTTAHTFLAVSRLRSVAGNTDGGNRLSEWNSNFGSTSI